MALEATDNIVPLDHLTYMHIMLGSKCNHRCIMCFQREYTTTMDSKIYRDRLGPIHPYLKCVLLQGGEPTIIPQTKELIQLLSVKNRDVKYAMMTNGHRFDRFWMKTFIESGERVNFSLNAASGKIYDRITKYGNWKEVIANLKKLIKMKKKRGRALPQIAASFVVLEENVQEMVQFITLCMEMGVDQARFFYDPNQLPKDLHFLNSQLDRIITYRDRIDIEGFNVLRHYVNSKLNRETFPPVSSSVDLSCQFTSQTIKSFCPSPFYGITVETDGRVRFCCMSTTFIGSLQDDGIEIIWNNDKAQSLRRLVRARQYAEAGCLDNCAFFD